MLVTLILFSSNQFDGIRTFKRSFIKFFFKILSYLEVWTKEGDALTSINQGFKFLSINISKPYSSKQWLSLMILYYTALRDVK